MAYQAPPSLCGLDFSEEEKANARASGIPLRITLETGRACNLRCRYCLLDSGKALSNELSQDELFNVADQARDLGVRTVVIIGGGEPLLSPNYLPLVEHVHGLGMQSVTFTNGTLMTPELAVRLFEMRTSVIGKLNSLCPGLQDYQVGKQGAAKRIYRGLENLIAARFNLGSPSRLSIETVMIRENITEVPTLWRWARDRNIVPYFELMLNRGRASEKQCLDNEGARTVFERLLEIDRQEYGFDWIPVPPIAATGCSNFYYNLYITAEGNVQACVQTPIIFGNIRKQPLAEIAQGPLREVTRHIDRHLAGKCAGCKVKPGCYGCRAKALVVTGNAFGQDPLCWHHCE